MNKEYKHKVDLATCTDEEAQKFADEVLAETQNLPVPFECDPIADACSRDDRMVPMRCAPTMYRYNRGSVSYNPGV